MRCQVGDLAILVRSKVPENVGKICTVIGKSDGLHAEMFGSDWEIQFPRPVRLNNGEVSLTGFCADSSLRPIRPGDLEDETPTEVIKELSNECL